VPGQLTGLVVRRPEAVVRDLLTVEPVFDRLWQGDPVAPAD
jgi:hypothetical protein